MKAIVVPKMNKTLTKHKMFL
uniref:Uncharacterized protein n=1 Tax=Anguilla anguilla TaxID=7936 RepID=A0A0E9R778_ANGAN